MSHGGFHLYVLRLWAWCQRWHQGHTAQPLRPLLEWLKRYPLLLVFTALPLACVWGAFGALGVPSLFLTDSAGETFLAGLVTALLLGGLCFVGYLLDADEAWALAPRGKKPEGIAPSLGWYFFSTLTYPALLLVLGLPALRADNRGFFLAGILVAVIIVLLLILFAEVRQERDSKGSMRAPFSEGLQLLRKKAQPPAPAPSWGLPMLKRLMGDRRSSHVATLHLLQARLLLLLIGGYLLISLYVSIWGAAARVPPAVVICTGLGILAAGYGAVRFYGRQSSPGVLILLFAVFLWGADAFLDEDIYSELGDGSPREYASGHLTDGQLAGLLEEEATRQAWLARMRTRMPPMEGPAPAESPKALCPAGPRPRLALIATSGGGIRAAAWTAQVLQELDRQIDGFARHVRLVSGASGGMVGAGAWVAALNEQGKVEAGFELAQAMRRDSLSPVTLALLLPFGDGRGRALERAWIAHTGEHILGKSFEQLKEGEAQGWRPSLIFTPMIVEDGRRLLVSNLDLSSLVVSGANVLVPEDPTEAQPQARLSVSGVQLFQLFPGRQGQLMVATAARMSASFPYMSPAAKLPTQPTVRVVDAGYYDNYGVDILAMWMHQHRQWIRECTSGVILIQIRDHLDIKRLALLGDSKPLPPRGLADEVAGLTSPPEAVLNAREASMSFRNDELIRVLHEEFNPPEGPGLFATVAFDFSETAPLSWVLSSGDIRRLECSTRSEGFQRRVRRVREWLGASPPPGLPPQESPCPR
jgi:hypothetical protein